MLAAENDENHQQKGIVAVLYNVGCRTMNPKLLDVLKHIRIIVDAIPMRVVAVHFCYDIPNMRPMALLMQNIMIGDHRLRFRSHYGT